MMTRRVHGAQHFLDAVGRDTLVLVDAGITSGGFLEHARQRGAHVLGALEAGVWEHLGQQRRLCDGSVLAWVPPSPTGQALSPVQHGLWVRLISYQVTDERLGELGQVYRLVTTLLNPRVAPALALIGLYHERWEIELVIDEVKTHERGQRKVFPRVAQRDCIAEQYKGRNWRKSKEMCLLRPTIGDEEQGKATPCDQRRRKVTASRPEEEKQSRDKDLPGVRRSALSY